MNHSRLAPGLLAAIAVVAAGSASADPVRWPAAGPIAYSFEPLAGWSYVDAGDHAEINADNHESALNLAIVTEDGRRDTPLPALAAEIIAASQSPPFSSSGPSAIGDRAGMAFLSAADNGNGVTIASRLVLVRLDPTHVAALTSMVVLGGDPADAPRMNAMIATIRLTGPNGAR